MTAAKIATAHLPPLRILITPTASGRKWRASHDGETLCASASPFITSARLLIAKGVDPNRTIEMWHDHADTWSLRGRLGAVAATLLDGETATQPAKNAPPARFPDNPLPALLEGPSAMRTRFLRYDEIKKAGRRAGRSLSTITQGDPIARPARHYDGGDQ